MNFSIKTPTSKNVAALNMLADVHAMFVLICQKYFGMDLEPKRLLISCITLGELPNLCKPHFPPLQNRLASLS